MRINFKSKPLAALLIVFSTLIPPFAITPAHGATPTFDLNGVVLPDGITMKIDRIEYIANYGGTLAYLTFTHSNLGEKSSLKFEALTVSGLPADAKNLLFGISYFDLKTQYPNFNIMLSDKDITKEDIKLTFKGTGTLHKQSDLAYPVSYEKTIENLKAMGLEVLNGYNVTSSDNTYGFYLEIKAMSGIQPFSFVISQSHLLADSSVDVPLTFSPRVIEAKSEPFEIEIGYSKTDPTVDLTGVKVVASFRKYVATTISSEITLPTGLESIGAVHNYYDAEKNQTTFYLDLKNTSSKNINVDMSKVSLFDETTSTVKKIGTILSEYSLATILPVNPANEYPGGSIGITVKGDLSESRKLNIKGNVKLGTPSTVKMGGLKLPSGYKLEPFNFSTISYDPIKKVTVIALEITKVGTSSSALEISKASIQKGKIDTTYSHIAPVLNESKDKTIYYHTFGTVQGDQRMGKIITISGKLSAVKRTPYTNTATLDNELRPLYVSSDWQVQPEYWKYDSKKKVTSLLVYIDAFSLTAPTTVYFCKLNITYKGESITPLVAPKEFKPRSNGYTTLALIPGDIRTKGGEVKVSGTYSGSGC
jgi:hypothetical protein